MRINAIRMYEKSLLGSNCKPRAMKQDTANIDFRGINKVKAKVGVALVVTAMAIPELIPDCVQAAKDVFLGDDDTDNRNKAPR